MTNTRKCHCFIHHPETEEEREAIVKALEEARRIGDTIGIRITLAQLTGECLSRKETTP